MPLVQSKLLGMECHIRGMSIAINTADIDWPADISSGTARLTLCIYKNCTGPLMVDFDGGNLGCHTINLTAPGDYYVQQAPQLKGWQEMRKRMSGIECMLVSFDLRKQTGSRSLVSYINGLFLRDVYGSDTKPREELCSCAAENTINPQGSSFSYVRPLPNFLFIHLARNPAAGKKDISSVVVPEVFVPEPWWFSDPEHGKGSYNLTRVVVFTGSIESGHYTIYCLHEGIWWLKDDLKGQSSDQPFGGSGVTKAKQGWLSSGCVRTQCCLLVYTKTGSMGVGGPPASCSHRCGSGIQLPPKGLNTNMSTASLCFSNRSGAHNSYPGPPVHQSDAVRPGSHRPTGPLQGTGANSCFDCNAPIALPVSPQFTAYYRVVSRLLGFESGLPLLCTSCWSLKNPISSRVSGPNPSVGTTKQGGGETTGGSCAGARA